MKRGEGRVCLCVSIRAYFILRNKTSLKHLRQLAANARHSPSLCPPLRNILRPTLRELQHVPNQVVRLA